MKVNDFLFCSLNKPGNTNHSTAFAVTIVFATQLPCLNNLDIAMANLDFAQGSVNVPYLPAHNGDSDSAIGRVVRGVHEH